MPGQESLLAALQAEKVTVVKTAGDKVYLKHKCVVKIEGPALYKLLDDGHVVAPFSSARELAGFVRMDFLQRGIGT